MYLVSIEKFLWECKSSRCVTWDDNEAGTGKDAKQMKVQCAKYVFSKYNFEHTENQVTKHREKHEILLKVKYVQ